MRVIAPGTPAPSFTLARADGESFTEQDLQGRTSVLVFYPFAFSPVCTDQLQLYEELRGELEGRGDALYGVSCDSTWAQSAFKEKLGVGSEQLSDFEPKGAACAAFGVLHPGGFPQRALLDHRPRRASCAGATRPPRPASCPAWSCCARASRRPPPSSLAGTLRGRAPRRGRRRHSAKLASVREKRKMKRTADRRAEQEGSEYE